MVESIKPLSSATARPGADGGLGGFGGLFDLAAAGYRDPILVAATDGVGTKLKIAQAVGRHTEIGIDLVAMCVNDLIVQGAEPLFFLDYFATGRLELGAARDVVSGIAEGCRQAGCALIGGETAEMPGVYADGVYDLAGFAVGAAERDALITGDRVQSGDIVLGLESDGLHSNGFSLVRHLVDSADLAYDDPAPFADRGKIGEALLAPTRIYVPSCLAAIRGHGGPAGDLRAFAHITGGGLLENIPRVVPGGLSVELDADAWPLPRVMRWLSRLGGIAPTEMARTFNCGIGMAVITSAGAADAIAATLVEAGERVHVIGRIRPREASDPAVVIPDLERVWRS